MHASSCSVYKTTGLQAIVRGMWVSGLQAIVHAMWVSGLQAIVHGMWVNGQVETADTSQ